MFRKQACFGKWFGTQCCIYCIPLQASHRAAGRDSESFMAGGLGRGLTYRTASTPGLQQELQRELPSHKVGGGAPEEGGSNKISRKSESSPACDGGLASKVNCNSSQQGAEPAGWGPETGPGSGNLASLLLVSVLSYAFMPNSQKNAILIILIILLKITNLPLSL